MDKKDVWSTSDVLASRNNWSLAADVELLNHLQSLSEKIFAKANATLQSLNSFENDVNQTCISITNTSNKFKSLSDTQFIESKVQEENSDVNEQSGSQDETPDNRENQNITVKLKEALENGFRVLDTQYDVIPVSGSDSEDDGPEEILLRARNPYLSRRLPHIIGSEEFTRNDNLGLIDSSSEEEEEEEEEEDDDEDDDYSDDNEEKAKKPLINSDDDNISIQKSPSPKKEFLRPRTEVIRISSSDSEESDVSIPYNRSNPQEEVSSENKKKPTEKSKENEFNQNPNSFAEHLNAALNNNQRNIYNIVPPDFGDTFSPPPFPGKNNDINNEDDSEDDGDIFATKKNTKHSISNTNYTSNYGDESDDDDDWNSKETGVASQKSDALGKSLESPRRSSIVSKTSQHSDTSSSSISNESFKKDSSASSEKFGSQSLPKSKVIESNANPINKRMASAINAELSAKLNLKNPSNKSVENPISTKTSVKSSESRTPVKTPAKSSENTTPVKTMKFKATDEPIQSTSSNTESKKTASFNKLDDENSSENDDQDDLFKGISATKKTAPPNKKSKGLFDDDDNIDNLFSSVKSTQSAAKKSSDLFSSEPSEPIKSDKNINEPVVKPSIVDLFKKSDLFASDSDSEDDIFSIIKGQKKVATDIFKTDDLFENSSSDSKPTLESNNETISTKTPAINPVIISAPAENKPSSLFTEEKLPSQKTSLVKSTDSAEQNVDKNNDVINAMPSPKNNLFEVVKKTTADLFQSDDDDDDDDLFSKKVESDERTIADENTNISKFTDLFADNSEAEKSKTDIFSSTQSVSNVANVTKKPKPKILEKNNYSKSGESLNETENSSHFVKSTLQDKISDVVAKIQSPELSSSSSSLDDEDLRKENTFNKVLDESTKDQNGKSVAKPSQNEDDLFDESSNRSDLFGEYGKFPTSIKNSKNYENESSSTKDDIFGETYGSRSAVFSPPKDDLSDGFSEDDDIKECSYLSQEDDDLFGEKFEPPPFQAGIPDENIFGEKTSADLQEQQKKSFTSDAAPVDDLFAKSTSSLPVDDIFHENDLFRSQRSDIEKNKELLENTSNHKFSDENLNSKNQAINGDEKLDKDDSIQKPLSSNEDKVHSADNVPGISEPKDYIFNVPNKSRLFGFNEKELFGSDSDEFDIFPNKTAISSPGKLIKSQETEPITPPEKISPSSEDKKSNENLEDKSASKKTSPNSKIDKINLDVSETTDATKKQGKDVQDGNLFAKSAPPEPVLPARSTPGKLTMGRGLNINVNALLPGSNWSSKMKQKQNTEQVTSDEKRVSEPAIPSKSQDVSEKSSGLLNNVIKERPKVSGKRRPPSRQARISRILTDDVFGGSGFGIESSREEEKSNVSPSSPNVREEVKVDESKKPERSVTFEDDLFGDDEYKIDDLFGTSRSKKEPITEKPNVISNTPVSNVSSSLEGSGDLNLGGNPSLNRLSNLTKDRAKPQKRPLQRKRTTTDVSPVVMDEQVTSTESKSKPVTKKLDTSLEESSILSNPSKHDLSNIGTRTAKHIFDSLEDDDDDDDYLFESLKSKKIIEEKSAAKDEVKQASQSSQQPAATKPKTIANTKIDIFKDDDEGEELFSSAKNKLSASKLSKKSSLFEDNDDDDLFGSKTSTSSKRKTSEPATTSIKTKPLNEKPRILKLRSETVQKDPLTGKDLSGPL